MLIQNYSYINCVLGHQHSGLTSPFKYTKPEVFRNFQTRDTADNMAQVIRDSFPTGTNPPYAYVLGNKGALLSSTTTINGVSTVTAGLVKGINLSSTIEGTSVLVSNMSLVTSLEATINGSGSLTASLVGIIELAAGLSGSASLAASLKLISGLSATLAGTGTLAANLKGTSNMYADIYVNESTATVNQLVEGVWNALAADFNASGTMGEALGAAGTAGDPWTTILPGGYTGDQAGAIVDRLETLIKQVKALTSAQL